MRRKLFLLSTLLVCLLTRGQDIFVEYTIEVTDLEKLDKNKKENSKNLPKEIFEKFNEAYKEINGMKSYLKSNKNEAIFWSENKLPNDVNNEIYNLALIIIGNKEKYYTNIFENLTIKSFNAYGEEFRLASAIKDIKWKLSKESKVISGYKCFRATTTYVTSNKNSDSEKLVTAWYTPEITYNFGPKKFSGLPGLIIELIDDNIAYKASQISFEDVSSKINKPKKGKLITEEELKVIGERTLNDFRRNH